MILMRRGRRQGGREGVVLKGIKGVEVAKYKILEVMC